MLSCLRLTVGHLFRATTCPGGPARCTSADSESEPPRLDHQERLRALRALIDRLSTSRSVDDTSADADPADALSEALAELLAADPRFRVLRCLQPRDSYSVPPQGPVRRGLVVDTETTGLDATNDRIVEIGMVAFDFDPATGAVVRVVDTYGALEDPGMPIPPEITRVNGISDAMVAGKRIDDDRVAALASASDLVIAHNAQFDRPVCEQRFPVFVEKAWACSLKQVDWGACGLPGGKLELLAYAHGFFYEAHRAETDCRALLEVLAREVPEGGTALRRLLETARRRDVRIWALDSPFESKDTLRARRYRWSGGEGGLPKAWHVTLPESQVADELQWLRDTIYGGHGRELRLDVLDARSRFTTRFSRSEMRAI